MLRVFETMNEEELYKLAHEVYIEGSCENARENHPELNDLTEAIKEEERYHMNFLRKFFQKEENSYYVLDVNGAWVSALRLTKLDGYYYLEALETVPEQRKKGYAAMLIQEVIAYLKERGTVVIRNNVSKTNVASINTHKKCGFVIERDPAINCVTGEEKPHCYGMCYGIR